MADPTRYRLVTLGRIGVERSADDECSLSAREFAFLLVLAWHAGREVGRDDLIHYFWNKDDRRSRHSLSQLLCSLRRKAPHVEVVSTQFGMRVESGSVVIDAQLLLAAGRDHDWSGVLQLYTGDFLRALRPTGTRVFADWVDRVAADIERTVLRAFDESVQKAINEGCWHHVLSHVNRVRHIHPSARELARLDAFATAALGDVRKAASISIVSPGYLARTKSANAESLRLLSDRSPNPSDFAGSTAGLAVPFVGRGEAFSALKFAFDSCMNGRSQVVIVRGPSGIGKSRLSNHFLRFAALRGARILLCSGRRNWEGVPYGLLADLLGSCSVEECLSDAPSALQSALTSLLPEGAAATCAPTLTQGIPEGEGTTAVLEGLRHVFRTLVSRWPLVVLVDQAELADELSLEQLLRSLEMFHHDHVMVVLCLRSDVPLRPAIEEIFVRLRSDRSCRTLSLGELSRSEVVELFDAYGRTRSVVVDEHVRDRLIRVAGGHPFFLIELLLQHCGDESRGFAYCRSIPESVQMAVQGRLDQLGERSRAIMEVLAIIGQPIGEQTLVSLVDRLPIDQLRGSLDILVQRGLVVNEAGMLRLAQDLIADVVIRVMGQARARFLHGLVASAMAHASRLPDAVIGAHYEQAGDLRIAASHYAKAGIDAVAADAYTVAERFGRFAVEHGDKPTKRDAMALLLGVFFYTRRYGEAWRLCSSQDDAPSFLLDRSGLEVDEPTLRLLADCVEERVVFDAVLERTGSLLATQAPLNLGHAELLRVAAGLAVRDSDVAWWRTFVDGFKAKAVQTSDDVASAIVLSACACVEAAFVSVTEAETTALHARDRSWRSGRKFVEGRARAAVGTVALLAGRLAVASHELEQARSISQSLGLFGAAAAAANNLAVAWMEQGRLRAAVDLLEAEAVGLSANETLVRQCNLSLVHLEMGNGALSRRHAERVVADGGRLQQAWAVAHGTAVAGLAAMRDGDRQDARLRCERVVRVMRESGYAGTDSSYALAFIADCERAGLGSFGAAGFLDEAIDAYSSTNVLATMRLRIARALLAGKSGRVWGVRTLLDVIDHGGRLQAESIVLRAESALALLQ